MLSPLLAFHHPTFGAPALRCAGALLIWLLVSWAAGSMAEAGCSYQYGGKHRASSQVDPRGHVRNFKFLGHWIFERGQIKYVKWHEDAPCDGPNCQIKEVPRPVSHTTAESSLVRLSFGLVEPAAWPTPREAIVSLISMVRVSISDGHPHAHEYPLRSTF